MRVVCIGSLVLCCAMFGPGCGKKGPPLAPIVRIPAAVTSIEVFRTGSDVFITLTVPARNIDSSVPVDISRIEIYGYTGRAAPPRQRWVEVGELVATVPVAMAPSDGSSEAPTAAPATKQEGRAAAPGMVVTVRDTLTADELAQGRVETPLPTDRPRLVAPVPVTSGPAVLRRFYVAFGFSSRGRPGPPGSAAEFALAEVPAPPAFVRTPYTESSVLLEWPPSDGIIGFLFGRSLAAEESPVGDDAAVATADTTNGSQEAAAVSTAVVASGPVRYNVYREVEPDPLALPAAAEASWAATRPAPVNSAPLEVMSFTDSVALDRNQCYVVRSVLGTPPAIVEGDPSPAACFTATDVFPPAAPQHLAAVADEGGISLIWEPNGEPDLGGYLVLRADASDATLQPLTATPVVESRFRDTHVTAGRKYVYAVVAVDAHLPASNVSAESNHVEETAR